LNRFHRESKHCDQCGFDGIVFVFSFFYALLWVMTPMYFSFRAAWYFPVTHSVSFSFPRLLFLQYPRVTRQFRPLLWRTVSRRYCMKNILLHEQESPPRDITITTHLVTWEPENPLICRCRQTKLRRMKHSYCRYMCNIFIK